MDNLVLSMHPVIVVLCIVVYAGFWVLVFKLLKQTQRLTKQCNQLLENNTNLRTAINKHLDSLQFANSKPPKSNVFDLVDTNSIISNTKLGRNLDEQ